MRNVMSDRSVRKRYDCRSIIRPICNLALAAAIAALPLVPWVFAQAPEKKSVKPWTPGRTSDGQPDIQGIWSNASIIPLERPKELANKPFYTPEELKAYEDRAFARSIRDKTPAKGAVGTYNDFWWDGDSKRALNLRTSLVVDPPDGRVPPYTPEAQRRIDAERAYSREHPADGPEDRSLMERCLLFPTTGPPMLPSFYNGNQFGPLTTNYQILQVPGYVVLVLEIIHDARVIPLDGRPHLAQGLRQYLGDARGRWDGNTLVVETTNFNGKGWIATNAAAARIRGVPHSDALRLVERFTRVDADTITYEVTVEDPHVYTRPWTATIPLSRDDSYQMFEYACHEGNRAVEHVLSGARSAERAATAAKKN